MQIIKISWRTGLGAVGAPARPVAYPWLLVTTRTGHGRARIATNGHELPTSPTQDHARARKGKSRGRKGQTARVMSQLAPLTSLP